MTYAISISGFKHELITKPFLAIPIRLDLFVLLATNHQTSQETYRKVTEFLHFANVETVVREVKDIYNFYEVYIVLETIRSEYGLPVWVNVTPGPGIAIAALTFFAINNKVPVVSYNSENNTSSIVGVHDSKNIFTYRERGFRILEALTNGKKSLQELADELGVSKSTVSRKVSNLKKVSFVNTIRQKRTMIVSLSDAGSHMMQTPRKKYP